MLSLHAHAAWQVGKAMNGGMSWCGCTSVASGAKEGTIVCLVNPSQWFNTSCKVCPQINLGFELQGASQELNGIMLRAGEGKMFSPGNLRATFDNPNYEKLISYYVGEKYTLRYTGGMVPDVFQIIVKEKGVFTNVSSPSTKAKLRLLFEVAPLGLLVS